MGKNKPFAKFAIYLGLSEHEAKVYLAGILEARRAINYKEGFIAIHMQNELPKLLHRVWGGTLFWHVQKGKGRSRSFRSNKEGTRQILTGVYPYLVFERGAVGRFLRRP